MAERSHITTHVLDTGTGRPSSGRIANLGPVQVEAGEYRVSFETGAYFGQKGTETFFPAVTINFTVSNTADHYHVPLLISPFAFSTYRGS